MDDKRRSRRGRFGRREPEPCSLLAPFERQSRVIQEFANGELWRVSFVEGGGDDVRRMEGEAEASRGAGRAERWSMRRTGAPARGRAWITREKHPLGGLSGDVTRGVGCLRPFATSAIFRCMAFTFPPRRYLRIALLAVAFPFILSENCIEFESIILNS
jgi:hypothetical protein